ncbi:hypothetical protein D3P07_11600 [Paenibacillus sp. 1011MAR3C5]|uniref:hypothetical protein n=1 Tax=Paenibacillus sp. 1011MAR3C5 TaxID=1675787 RepID=UPI000E6C0C61|nr:hypothetical protein [Paenibacillus sp. 1011MAR3C5]RJE88631.1 hypothetical protein D3P07_11600 [Paenibacillus sp. 1011MAR3C5]
MYPTSELYRMLLLRPDREFLVKVDVGGTDYGMNEIVDMLIETNLLASDEFEIGTVFRSRLTLRMRLNGAVPNNARIIPYTAFDSSVMTWEQAIIPWDKADIAWGGGAGEWLPLGEYYINKRQKVNDVWEFECYCKLIWTEQPYVSNLTYPAKMQDVWDEICTHLNYTYDSTVQINPSYMVPFKPVGMTCNEVMGYIAGANSASVRTGKDGKIQFAQFTSVFKPVLDLADAQYMRAAHTNPIKEYTRFVVTYDDEQDLVYEAGSGDEDRTLYYYNPFMTQEIVDDLETTLGGFKYQPLEMDARGYPPLDAGDWIGYEVYEGTSWRQTITPWQDTNIPWNGMVQYGSILFSIRLGYHGGFKMLLDAPSKSPQQSEFVVEGQLTKKVNQINKEAVKLGRNYYGTRTSREEGFVVETEGGSGKGIFNSDELSFWADGERALWFDIPNKKFIFSGTLEGVDGTFSGTISASEINGSTINGGGIYGAYIATGLGTYPFVELSNTNNLIAAYGDANKYVKIESNLDNLGAPMIRFGFNGKETWLAQISSGFLIFGPDSNVTYTVNNLQLGESVQVGGGAMVLGSYGVPAATDPDDAVVRLNQLIALLSSMGILA